MNAHQRAVIAEEIRQSNRRVDCLVIQRNLSARRLDSINRQLDEERSQLELLKADHRTARGITPLSQPWMVRLFERLDDVDDGWPPK